MDQDSHGEAPRPPKQGDGSESKPQEQLKREPEGDAPSGAVKVEGLMDSSDSPMKM
jgi:protein phosphatase 2C family protein 2/3